MTPQELLERQNFQAQGNGNMDTFDKLCDSRIDLDSNTFVVKENGLLKFLVHDGRLLLFSVSDTLLPFEEKALGAVLNLYLMALQRGREQVKPMIRAKLDKILSLVFED